MVEATVALCDNFHPGYVAGQGLKLTVKMCHSFHIGSTNSVMYPIMIIKVIDIRRIFDHY